MNIFVLDEHPLNAAKFHCDKHICKMIVESAQLISTAIKHFDPNVDGFYKATHVNHPCNKWLLQSISNISWLIELGQELCIEYTKRYKKIHKTSDMFELAKLHLHHFPQWFKTPFALAMPEQFKSENTVDSYRLYYAAAKYKFAKWNHSETPYWWTEYRNYVIINNLEIENLKDDGVII